MTGLRVVPIKAYCMATGETTETIDKRVERGVWRQGKHVLKLAGVKGRWIDLDEVTAWAREKENHVG